MAKRERKPLTVHGCINVGGQIVCFDSWPKEVRAGIIAQAMAAAIPVLNPGYRAAPGQHCDVDVREYITPECIIRFPWMGDDAHE